MKTVFLSALLSLLTVFSANAQLRLSSGTVVTAQNAFGLDKPYDFNTPALTEAPDGFKPFFIEHYGRHGSRFAYSHSFYTGLMTALENAEKEQVLTSFGKDLLARYSIHYQTYLYRMGDLSNLGWQQLGALGSGMYANFPEAFPEGAVVKASASSSFRSVMSMSSFCLGLTRACPYLDIKEEQGRVFLDGTNPRDGSNPFQKLRNEPPFPFEESLTAFQQRRVDSRKVLSRLFLDVDKACKDMDIDMLVRDLYVLTAGMNSLDESDRTDFTGLFTEEEYALMWEVDNYDRYIEYFPYVMRVIPVVLDIVKDAQRRIESGQQGATLRFGHDHVMMPLLVLFGVHGFENQPESTDKISEHYCTWHSPMATNFQIVFYKNDTGEILVKFVHNGREERLAVATDRFPYYRWEDVAAFALRFENK